MPKYRDANITEAEYGYPTGTKTLKSINAKFDDAVFKVPPHKLTRDWVLKVAKKYKVKPTEAIQWVNLNPKLNIKEAGFKNLTPFEHKLRLRGEYDGYIKEIEAKNSLDIVDDMESYLLSAINATSEGYVSEKGEVERWIGGVDKKKFLKI